MHYIHLNGVFYLDRHLTVTTGSQYITKLFAFTASMLHVEMSNTDLKKVRQHLPDGNGDTAEIILSGCLGINDMRSI